MINEFVIDLPNIKWSQKEMRDMMYSYPDNKWFHERNLGDPTQTYVSKYLRVPSNSLFDEIYNQFPKLNLSIDYSFFSSLDPKTLLPPHVDQGRSIALNFPVEGDWSKTPVRFHDKKSMSKDSVLYEHTYGATYPTFLNVSKIHSVYNTTSEVRYILSISVHGITWEELIDVVSDK